MSIRERIEKIQAEILAYATAPEVMLIAVSKYAAVEQMREAYAAGIRHFGENKIQDALTKMEAFPAEQYPDLQWHFIGTLQTNKAKKTVGRFACIHAIEASHQATAVSQANLNSGQRQNVLIQINLSTDPARHGFMPDQIRSDFEALLKLEGIAIRGLMTMAPPEASLNLDRQALKAVFCGLRDMRGELTSAYGIQLPDLSMGMSHDYVPALECGATIIRVGNLIFKN
jgi:hypothetical protein